VFAGNEAIRREHLNRNQKENMNHFEHAHKAVCQLVKDFQTHEKRYLSSDYSEAQARLDFIDKFFTALGWDVNHETQKNPYEQEVKVEKGVNVARAQKRADYAFCIAPNFRDAKFFVEAKKPAKALSNPDDYFQTARYGWNANTPLAVLTDFEEFHIIDCRFKPNIGTALKQKLKHYHYSEYADKEKFAEIYWLFSHEAVEGNSLEKHAETLKKPTGKAVQRGLFPGGYQPIDEAFLEEIDEIRKTLAKAFKKNCPEMMSNELTEAVQRTVDRLVFIRFLEDKLIEPENYLDNIGTSGQAWAEFIALCRKLDKKYNGVVFKETSIDLAGFEGPVDAEFRNICEELSRQNSPYDFNFIPIHILGSIYERFLGKEVHATAKRVDIEEKPEVRKAGGVYYTPQYIVRYIVENTIGKLIEGKTPEEIAKLRFADIACGSGSFLIGALELLLDYHHKYYQGHPEKAKKDGCYQKDGKWVLNIRQKQSILLNNIYGVDIDPQAIEVTQLSLALKMLEDETTATANDMQVLFHSAVLPDLTKNIVCGNSLIGTDILQGDLFALDKEEERKLNPMDFKSVFPGVMKNGGFDAVIGNPPYVNLVSIEENQRKYFQNKFKTCKNKSDLYSFFLENALRIVNRNYKLGYIIPHTWLATDSFSLLREKLLNNEAIESIAEMGFKVFKKVVVSTVVLISSNGNKNIKVLNNDFTQRFIIPTSIWTNDNNHIDLNWNKTKYKLFDKIKENTITLEKVLKFTRGIKTSNDDRFILSEKRNKDCKPIYRGKNIKAYQLNWGNEYVWYRPDLMKEKVGCLPHTKELFETTEKLVTQRVNSSMQLLVAYDDKQNYFLDTTNVSEYNSWDKKHSLKFIAGLLNSRLLNYWYCQKYKMPTIGLYELHSIPIKPIDFKNKTLRDLHDNIVKYVDQMIDGKKQLNAAKTEADKNYYQQKCQSLDNQIDKLVYELYGLTDEEIKVVEG